MRGGIDPYPPPMLARLQSEGARADLVLDRPEARNPTSIAMLDAMDAALDGLDDGVRVLVLSGAGRAFCSGLDLAEVRAGEETIRTLLARLGEVMRRLRRLPQVTVARVQGGAIGGGFGFAVAADFCVTHPEAKLGYPPLSTGLSPALMAPWLVRKIGPSAARAMLLSGGTISGREALARGIATHLAERDGLDGAVSALVDHLLTAGPHAATAMKRFLNELDGSLDDEMLDRAAAVSAEVIAHRETQEKLEGRA